MSTFLFAIDWISTEVGPNQYQLTILGGFIADAQDLRVLLARSTELFRVRFEDGGERLVLVVR